MNNIKTKVAITKCPDYQNTDVLADAIYRQFELLGGIEKFISAGDRVLIKPNMIAPMPPSSPAQTHPAVIIGLAKLLVDFGAKPFVADSPAWADAIVCGNAIGIVEPLKKLGVEVKQLNRPIRKKLPLSNTIAGISREALQADKVINLPKLKAHQQLIATIAVKNMFGTVSGKAKAIWHFRRGGSFEDFCTMLIDVYNTVSPVLTIVDAVVAMEGAGPIRGNGKNIGLLVGTTDAIAAEIICSDIMGIDCKCLPVIQTAEKLKIGCYDRGQIELLGDCDFKAAENFKIPQQIALRFSLPRIIKSIINQILILIKAKK